jgi:hypothetical protein
MTAVISVRIKNHLVKVEGDVFADVLAFVKSLDKASEGRPIGDGKWKSVTPAPSFNSVMKFWTVRITEREFEEFVKDSGFAFTMVEEGDTTVFDAFAAMTSTFKTWKPSGGPARDAMLRAQRIVNANGGLSKARDIARETFNF